MATIASVITYIPTIGENDQKPPAEQFAVKLKAVNMKIKQEQLLKFISMDPKQLMKQMMDPRQQTEIVKLLNEHFVRFVNFDVTDVVTEKDVKENKKGYVDGSEKVLTEVGEEYTRPATIEDIFNLGEFELAMEIFMHLIGSSQLRKTIPIQRDAAGNVIPATVTQEREDEEKNSESLSGTSLTNA